MTAKNRKRRKLYARMKKNRSVVSMDENRNDGRQYFDDSLPSSFWDDYEKRENKAKDGVDDNDNVYTPNLSPWLPKNGVIQYPYSKYVSKCTHKGNVKVFETKHLVVYGGGANRNAVPLRDGINIDLSGYLVENPVKIWGFSVPSLSKHLYSTIEIDWKDGSVIEWCVEEWKALIEDLNAEAIRRNKKLSVLVACLGGHGRTGTALSILASLCGAIPAGMEAIEWVRKNYCQEAVETQIQEKYVDLIIKQSK